MTGIGQKRNSQVTFKILKNTWKFAGKPQEKSWNFVSPKKWDVECDLKTFSAR